ncbi:MAG: hypothetical protein IT380_16485 [Myxococcales bacterium]|nr:hypothetical protein [Myxococcales bacterium]
MLEVLALTLALSAGVLQTGETDAEEAAPEAPVAMPLDGEEEDPDYGTTAPSVLLKYQLAQLQRATVGGGATKVSVETNAPTPAFGTFPVRVFVDNSTGPKQTISLSFRGNVGGGFHSVARQVELNAGERRVVNLPAPAELRYGTLRASGPGITEGGEASVYFNGVYASQKVVLTLSGPERFQAFVGKPPSYARADVFVMTIPAPEAPVELAGYLGYDAVLVPDATTLESLDEGQRRALEAYAATGGHLVVKGPLRATTVFPLLSGAPKKVQPYGLGRLAVVDEVPDNDTLTLRAAPPVRPQGPVPEYERRYRDGERLEPLLPQATAPLGRFLLIITAFTLAIGPGSIWVARRRGPAALLVTIPGTAFVTCVAIISYSLIADGFTVHAAMYSFTRLDSKQHRALTAGVTAYYANLAPGRATFSASTVPIPPWDDSRERFMADMTWKDGLTMGSDFVPSRVYREWGFLSLEPTRARLALKQSGDGWVVQNALGHRVAEVAVRIDGLTWEARDVKDGGEGQLVRGGDVEYRAHAAASRFGPVVADAIVHQELGEGQFLARLEGEGFLPTGGLHLALHASEHWVRGEVEP